MRVLVSLLSVTLIVGLIGCSSDSTPIHNNQVPSGVTAAFTAEHPYAKMEDPKVHGNQNGPESYEFPYSRPDGTKGTAVYSPSGVLLDDK